MAGKNQMGSSDRGYSLDHQQDKNRYVSQLWRIYVLIDSIVSKLVSLE